MIEGSLNGKVEANNIPKADVNVLKGREGEPFDSLLVKRP